MKKIVFLLPNFSMMYKNKKFPRIAPIEPIDMTVAASLMANGPLGNVVFFSCSFTKLTVAHPFADPNEAVSKFPIAKQKIVYFVRVFFQSK